MSAPTNARFLLRPWWLLSHLFVLALVVTMVSLGFWQLRRLDEKRERNDLIQARQELPMVPVQDLVAPGAGDAAVDDARFRRVAAEGVYDDGDTVVVRNRSQDGIAGAWLVTPLELDGGGRVGVLRGFVSFAPDGSVVEPAAPAGDVRVEGLVVDPGSFDGTAPQDLAPLLGEDDIVPALVLAEASTPPEPAGADATDAVPASILAVPPPELNEGPHLGYAAQWFIFSAIAVIGYPLVLRRVVARRGKELGHEPEATEPPDEVAADDLDGELADLLRREG